MGRYNPARTGKNMRGPDVAEGAMQSLGEWLSPGSIKMSPCRESDSAGPGQVPPCRRPTVPARVPGSPTSPKLLRPHAAGDGLEAWFSQAGSKSPLRFQGLTLTQRASTPRRPASLSPEERR